TRSTSYVADGLGDHPVGHEEVATRRGRAADRLELDGWQPLEESLPASDDRRRDDEPELVDHARGKQRLCHRDAGVDTDVATPLVLEATHERHQVPVDRG